MIHFRRFKGHIDYIPIEAKDTKELLNHEEMKSFEKQPDFYRWSTDQYPIDRNGNIGWHLMAEQDNGYKWWVVGISEEPLDLPLWEAKYPKGDLKKDIE